jgi:uncharacterized membrane protein
METTEATQPADRASLLPTALIGAAFLVVAVIFASSSSWYLVFKSVHVGFAVIWIGGGALLTILAVLAERRIDPHELATIARQAAMVGEKLFAPAGLVVFSMGIAMMINTDWGWNHFWITFGLLGFVWTFATGMGYFAPASKRLHELMQTVGPTAPETQAAIARILFIARLDIAVLLLVVVDMVVKPFS